MISKQTKERIKDRINGIIFDNYAQTFEGVIDKIIEKEEITIYDEGDIDYLILNYFENYHYQSDNSEDVRLSYNKLCAMIIKSIRQSKGNDEKAIKFLLDNAKDIDDELGYKSKENINFLTEKYSTVKKYHNLISKTFKYITKHKEGIFIVPSKTLIVKDKKDYRILAHEIGHFVLHSHDKIYTYVSSATNTEFSNEKIVGFLKGIFYNERLKDYPFGDTKQEKEEADFFALHFIMHDSKFIKKYYEHFDEIDAGNYKNIAKYFNVPLKDAKSRVKELEKELEN